MGLLVVAAQRRLAAEAQDTNSQTEPAPTERGPAA